MLWSGYQALGQYGGKNAPAGKGAGKRRMRSKRKPGTQKILREETNLGVPRCGTWNSGKQRKILESGNPRCVCANAGKFVGDQNKSKMEHKMTSVLSNRAPVGDFRCCGADVCHPRRDHGGDLLSQEVLVPCDAGDGAMGEKGGVGCVYR